MKCCVPSEVELAGDPLVARFEAASVKSTTFGHREHLYVAWCYLRVLPLEHAVSRYVEHLRKLTVALGVPDKFHATITWVYILALDSAMVDHPGLGFDALLDAQPRLLDSQRSVLWDHYDRDEIASDAARTRFVLPRRALVRG